jgi:hypothetical protein
VNWLQPPLRLDSVRLGDADSGLLVGDAELIEPWGDGREVWAFAGRLLLLGGLKLRELPLFPFAAAADEFADLGALLFISLPEAGVPALGFPFPEVAMPRDATPLAVSARPPAATGEKWLCCMDCCRCAVCCWNDCGREALGEP